MCAPSRQLCLVLLGSVVVAMASTAARAQSGAALLLKPWATDQAVETTTDAYFLNAEHSAGGDSLQLSDYESTGRLRLQPGNLVSPRIGYNFTFLNSSSRSGVIPRNLTDLSIGVGTAIGQYHGWVAGVTLGVGYAGESAFSRDSGWYGKATFDLGKPINDHDTLAMLIDYDGNRPYFPEIPLPGFAYRHKIDDHILLVAGLPYSSLEWTPTSKLKIEASYRIVSQVTARVGYRVLERLLVYGSYKYVQDAFHVQGLGSDQRLLFSDERLEGGFEYSLADQLMIRLAGGYAFDNRFASGFDFDHTHHVLSFSDGPYFHAAFELRF
jgi:hypothetical protein